MKERQVFPSLGRCSLTGKLRFAFQAAKNVARQMRRQKGTNHRPYRCPACRDWHVGSSEPGHRARRRRPRPTNPRPTRLTARQFIEAA